jgi:hypothetical protein
MLVLPAVAAVFVKFCTRKIKSKLDAAAEEKK